MHVFKPRALVCWDSREFYRKFYLASLTRGPYGTHLEIVQILLRGRSLGTWQDLEAKLKAHQGRGQLLQDAEITLGLSVSIGDLVCERLRARHDLTQTEASDGQRQVGILSLVALNISQRGIAQLDDELFTVRVTLSDG